MTRSPRVHAEGLVYHVMARGNDGQKYTLVSLNQLTVNPGPAHATSLSALREDHAATVSRCATLASLCVLRSNESAS